MSLLSIQHVVVATGAAIGAALGAIIRRFLDHPLEIGPLDGSAATLWPHVPEDPREARWRVPDA
jgi:hypothetical protein